MRTALLAGCTFVMSASAWAGEVADKCSEAMTAIGAPNVEQGCACFEDETKGDLAKEYLALDLSRWNEDASDGLKQAAEKCFPSDNTNS